MRADERAQAPNRTRAHAHARTHRGGARGCAGLMQSGFSQLLVKVTVASRLCALRATRERPGQHSRQPISLLQAHSEEVLLNRASTLLKWQCSRASWPTLACVVPNTASFEARDTCNSSSGHRSKEAQGSVGHLSAKSFKSGSGDNSFVNHGCARDSDSARARVCKEAGRG